MRSKEKIDKAILQAESSFICDAERRPLEYWHQEYLDPLQQEIDWTRRYALDNRWQERRQSFWRGVQSAWLRQQQMALLQTRASELIEATELKSQIYEMIKPRMVGDTMVFPIQPKSYEGIVRTWIHLDDLVEGKRDAVMAQVDPMLNKAEAEMRDEEVKPQLPFSGEEMRTMAHQLLKARRKKRRAEMMIEDDAITESGAEEGEGGLESADGSGRHERAGELDS